MANGAWLPITASVDWCEQNYNVSYYIAEFFNCMSGLCIIFAAGHMFVQSMQLKTDYTFRVLAVSCAMVGAGTMLFHGTLKYWAQMFDELPMVVMILAGFNCLVPTHLAQRAFVPRIIVVICGVVYIVCHAIIMPVVLFQGLFGAFALVFFVGPVAAPFYRDNNYRRLHLTCFVIAILSFLCWLADRIFCDQLEFLKLHAFWHMGTAMLAQPTFCSLLYLRYTYFEANSAPAVKLTWHLAGTVPFASFVKRTAEIDVQRAQSELKNK